GEVVVGLLGRDGLYLTGEAEDVPEHDERAFEVEGRGHQIKRTWLDPREVPRRDLDAVADGVPRALLEEDALARHAGRGHEAGHDGGFALRWCGTIAMAARGDDGQARAVRRELSRGMRPG